MVRRQRPSHHVQIWPWRLYMCRIESESVHLARSTFITMLETKECEIGELLIEIEPLSVKSHASSVA
jgi:hypothetical protein